MKRSRLISLIMAALLLITVLAACNQEQSPSPAAGTGTPAATSPNPGSQHTGGNLGSSDEYSDTLRIAYSANLGYIGSDGDMFTNIMIGQPLFNLTQAGELVPALAESYEVLRDGSLKITLKKDVVYSNGAPFTAADVKFRFDRYIATGNTHVSKIERLESIELTDDYTIIFHFKEGCDGATFLYSLPQFGAHFPSRTSYEDPNVPDSTLVGYVGTGMWMVEEFVQDEYSVLVPNPNFLGQKPQGLQKLYVYFIPSAESRIMALQAGDVDLVMDHLHGGTGYTPRNQLGVLERAGFDIYPNEVPMTYNLMMCHQVADKPWSNPKVREAVTYAINVEEVVSLFDGYVNPATNKVFSDMTPFMEGVEGIDNVYDPARARALLEEAGYDFDYTAVYLVNSANADETKIAEIITAQLAAVGIKTQIVPGETAVLSELRNTFNFDLYTGISGGPFRMQYSRFDSAFGDVGFTNNHTWYASAETLALYYTAAEAYDMQARRVGFQAFFSSLAKDRGVVSLYYENAFFVASQNVEGFYVDAGEPHFENVMVRK